MNGGITTANEVSFQKIYDCFSMSYRKILHELYPAIGSNFFTEKNLSVNFCNAYLQKQNPEAIVWYERAIADGKNKNNNHIDAFLFDPITDGGSIFLIESKRLQNAEKLSEIEEDWIRLGRPENIAAASTNLARGKEGVHSVFRVVLIDAWRSVPPSRHPAYEKLFQKLNDATKPGGFFGSNIIVLGMADECKISLQDSPAPEIYKEAYQYQLIVVCQKVITTAMMLG